MQLDPLLATQVTQVIKTAQRAGLTIVTAESCTAGLLSNVLSTAPGAGTQLNGGFVTYTKEAKTRVLGASADVLERKTAVHEDIAIAMAEGALASSPGDIAIAVTGVAGPSRTRTAIRSGSCLLRDRAAGRGPALGEARIGRYRARRNPAPHPAGSDGAGAKMPGRGAAARRG